MGLVLKEGAERDTAQAVQASSPLPPALVAQALLFPQSVPYFLPHFPPHFPPHFSPLSAHLV